MSTASGRQQGSEVLRNMGADECGEGVDHRMKLRDRRWTPSKLCSTSGRPKVEAGVLYKFRGRSATCSMRKNIHRTLRSSRSEPDRVPSRSEPKKQRGLGLSSCAVPSHTPGAQFRRTKIRGRIEVERKQVSGKMRIANLSRYSN